VDDVVNHIVMRQRLQFDIHLDLMHPLGWGFVTRMKLQEK